MTRFVESFDHYNGIGTGDGLLARWQLSDAALVAPTQAMVPGRFGTGQAFSAGAGGGSTIRQTNCLLTDATGGGFAVTDFRMHVALSPKNVSANGSECGFCLCSSTNALQLGLRWIANTWQLVRWGAAAGGSPAAILWTSPAVFSGVAFHSFSLKGTIHPSAGAVDLQIDGVPAFSLGVGNTGTGVIDRVGFAQGNADGAAGVTADDLVVENTKVAYLPDLRIDPLPPVSDDAHLDLVPSAGVNHYAVVDESPVSVADYLSGSLVGEYDSLNLANLAALPASILGVNLVGFAAKTDVATRAWNLGADSGGTVSLGPDYPLATTPGYFSRFLEDDPATAAAWLAAGVDALKLRPRVAV